VASSLLPEAEWDGREDDDSMEDEQTDLASQLS
jgi:hypothetical protein